MNPQHLLIDNACRIEVNEGNFTEEQKKRLFDLLDKFISVKISNVWKFTKTLKAFEDAFIELGGNHAKLEEGIRKIRDEQYMAAIKAVPGLKVVKNEVK